MDEQTAQSLLSLAEEGVPRLRGLESKSAFAELERRYGDFLAALDWLVERGGGDAALRLATALAPFWMATKRMQEGFACFEKALAAADGDDVHRGRATFDAGMIAFWMGDDEGSTALHERALELGRRAGDPTVTSLALGGLARIALRAGDLEEARTLCREALAVTDGTDDRAGRSGALHVLSVTAQMSGDLDEARDLMTERLALMRELENYAGVSVEASNLGMVERQLGNLDRAEALAREALDIVSRRGDEMMLPWMLNGLAAVAAERGAHQRAATLLGAADALLDAQGAAWPPDERVHYDRTVETSAAALGSAAYEEARELGRATTSEEAVVLGRGGAS